MTAAERNIQRLNQQIVRLDRAANDARLAGDADSAGTIAWTAASRVGELMDALAGDARTKADQR